MSRRARVDGKALPIATTATGYYQTEKVVVTTESEVDG